MACTKCNPCTDLGYKNFVYPECIITKVAYPCLGVAAGKTGVVLFAAIETAICTITGMNTNIGTIQGDITTIEGDITSINTSITEIEGCLYDASGNCLVDEIQECLFDSTGGCEIDNLQISITSIEGDIITINNTLAELQDDGAWKTIGGGGNFDDWRGDAGPAVPGYNYPTSSTGSPIQVRKTASGRIAIRGYILLDDPWISGQVLFTLPVGYRPVLDIFLVVGADGTPFSSIAVRANGNIQIEGYVGLTAITIPEIEISLD